MKFSSDRPFSISWRIDSVRLWAPNSSATSFSRISNSNRYLKVLCSVLSALAALRLTPLIHEINASAVEALTIGYTLVQATMRNHGHARSRQPVPEIHLVSGLVQFNVLDAYLPAHALLRHALLRGWQCNVPVSDRPAIGSVATPMDRILQALDFLDTNRSNQTTLSAVLNDGPPVCPRLTLS